MRTLAEERERLKRLAAEYKRRKKGTEAIDAQIRDITNRLLRKELRQMKRKAA